VKPLLDVSQYTPEELTATESSASFPVVISLQSVPDEPPKADESNPPITSQITFATLLLCADSSYAIKVVKQKFPRLGNMYNLHDIFGLDYTGERENEGSRECVVCLSEPRTTTILPCNHLCLCAACAELMRTQTNKCPICRAPVKKLLTIHLSPSELNGTQRLSAQYQADNTPRDRSDEDSDDKDDEPLSRARGRDKV